MNVKGKHVLRADVATIWPMLQDEEVLARISPGVSRIEKVAEDQYRAISDISIGPVRGSFEGELSLLDKIEHETMTLSLAQKSKIGNAEANIIMTLTPQEDGTTEIGYNGKAKVSGRLATMGQRILGGVISTLSKQVFKELEQVIDERGLASTSEQMTSPEATREVSHSTEESSGPAAQAARVEPSAAHISEREKSHQQTGETSKSFIQIIIDKIESIWK